jgi:hypothetical protein
MAEMKVIDETHKISDKRGNGKLAGRYGLMQSQGELPATTWPTSTTNLFASDNGRVVGYDNAHDGHHRHYFGVVEPIAFVSFEDVEQRFEQDWIALKDRK